MASYMDVRKSQAASFAEEMKAKLKKGTGEKRDPTADDPNFWTTDHVIGESGSGYARIRFLPPSENETDAYVFYHEHIFQGEDHWYVNRSRTTLGSSEKDPVFEYNGKFFKDKTLTKEERMKRLLPRKTNYVANIYVIEDPNKPENEGRVFKFKFGPQVFSILHAAMFPETALDKEINPFDPFEGHTFIFKAYLKSIPQAKEPVPSYDKSSFEASPSSIVDNPDDFDAIWHSQFSLLEEIAPSKFKPYKELKARFDLVMGRISEDEYNELMGKEPAEKNDEPTAEPKQQKKVERTEARSEPAKSLAEEMKDEIPFANDEPAEQAAETTDAADDDDDWFNRLKR